MAHAEMPVKTAGAGVFLELRKRLQSGLLIIRKDVAHNPSDVVVTGRDSTLHIQASEVELNLALPPGVTVEPGSVTPTSAGDHCKEELHFRLRISTAQYKDVSDEVMETLRAKETYCFHCQACMTRLLEDRFFQRVLPLPNGNWNAIVDDWCCHADPFANKKLLPRAMDCLLGDTFLLLLRDGSCEHTLTEEISPVCAADSQDPKKSCRRLKVLSCKSCSSELGEAVAPETLKLYITQVVVERIVGDRRPGDSLSRSLFLERTVADKLCELSNSLSTFHFSVQTPDGKAFLLIWLLNSDSIVASIPWSDIKNPARSIDSSLDPLSPSLSATRALKLLYVSCSDTGIQQRDIVTNWEVNSIGHPLVLPMKVCEELQQVMDESNVTLPASLRCMQSYQVAYLRLCVPNVQCEDRPVCEDGPMCAAMA
ncbi:E3 ubiquitin-protein ligase E3D [Eucyclogobius newberryi]|uniref:E3 ubiquitin-protein ligase E3D n=1 Tax=Eucyclogobius newberryi TaxID=166745 RepID=UPI003B5C0991